MTERYTIALIGNPNSGKTTIFNRLTGAHQRVGNYPGVTVEYKEGVRKHDGAILDIVDLPGIYSLSVVSEEELVARNFIIEKRPHVVVDVIDATTVERQLYLAIQLIELGVPLVLAFNMTDEAERTGLKFDLDLLSELLGVPIVPTVGTTGGGLKELIETAMRVARGELVPSPKPLSYGRDLDQEIEKITRALDESGIAPFQTVPTRWTAIKLLENDTKTLDGFDRTGGLPASVTSALDAAHQRLRQLFSDSPEILIAEARYGIIAGAVSETVTHTMERRRSFSDSLDTVLINPVLGLPVFLALMYLVFTLTFRLGNPLIDLLDRFFQWVGLLVSGLWPEGAQSPLRSLLVDGIIGGVGGVLVFVPTILILFVAIAFLEDSGYMARAAFIMDRLMHRIGLHGKSFIPMLIGFGCSVPAIMGTRILENPRDRLVTTLVIPLMSCSARLPIYALIIPAFFPGRLQGPMLWLIYFVGIAMAVLLTKLLRTTVFRGESSPFVMELPPYRVPTVHGLLIHSWERVIMYVRKAGTLILAVSIVLWWATSYPKLSSYSEDYESELRDAQVTYIDGGAYKRVYALVGASPYGGNSHAMETGEISRRMHEEELTHSVAGRFAVWIEPALKPMGFDWRIGTALIGAIAAKEVFVAQLGIVYSVGETRSGSETLRKRLQEDYTPLVGLCIMLYVLISAPCIATIAMTRAETGSWKWALLQFFGLTALAWIVATLVYRVGSALGWGV